ncbi:hypothetical protein CKM354_000726300 [Cercospora kikuchii]|uniref:Uncharacterized protein n=1 Tax=Cercospora kikuchii TaxID=84275 RepID=A0A9P3FIM9_9PEZI|nr:uncharacterized protein CKM354_000726300 [Cercospora kikuchii]GIZ44054.1 hypothetical protein CKM354_000726300 [Cercospora kikuchii]
MSGSPRRAAGVAEELRAFIDRMELMYEYLIGEGYVRHMDIQVPPHGLPKDPVDVINLRGAGLEPDTIELIGILPCFCNYANAEHRIASRLEYDIPIAPGCAAVSYLVNSFLPEDFRDVGNDERMPPTTFKIATAIGPAGWNIAYDMQKKMITKWPLNGWANRHDVSVEDFFSDWAQHVKSGEWVFSATPACFLRTIQVRLGTGTNGHAHDNGH